MQTNNVGHPIDGIVATRVVDQNRISRLTYRDDRMAPTHDNIETISEKLVFHKYIRDSEFETRKVLERETSNQMIENIRTRLNKTQLDDYQMNRSMDSSKHREKHKPEVTPDETSSSDLSDSSSSDLRASKKKRTKKKKRCKHQKDDSSEPSSSDDSDSSDDSHYKRKRRKNKIHWKKDPIRLCATLTANC